MFPTLSRKRLPKALAYSKAEYGLRETKHRRELKEALVGIAKYQSLWLSGGWSDPAIKDLLPAMFTRDAVKIQSEMEEGEAQRLLAQLL